MAIHQQLSLFGVADQKQAKLLLARYLSDREMISLKGCVRMQVELMQQNLNLYFNTFVLACEAYRNEDEFWELLEELRPLGEYLKECRVYYRQTLLRTLLYKLKQNRLVHQLFEVMQVAEPKARLVYLLGADSLFAYYQFVTLAASADIDMPFLTKCAKELLTNDKSSIPYYVREDVVNFITHYFNGLALRYPFRRAIDPALLSYAERSFDAFSKVIVPAKRIDI
ncbi:MAG: hypothetical protein HUJ98_06595 [Bacteroidaceae bacterium]|nr:hypothetical protein [Bacteroidaceae bacterium]